jgi:YD repeat-containing protein
LVSGVLQRDPDVVESLVQLFSGGWRFTDAADNVELYDVNGKLTSITTRSGLVQTLGSDGNGRLATVTDSHGRQPCSATTPAIGCKRSPFVHDLARSSLGLAAPLVQAPQKEA